MANMTLSIPDDIHKELKKHPKISWSEVARQAIVDELEVLREIERIAQKSNLTQKDADELSKKVNKAASRRLLEEIRSRQ